MAATDQVRCFLTGQDYRWETPTEIRPRSEVRDLKQKKLGKFVENGKVFIFFEAVAQKAERLWDGRMSAANLIRFGPRPHNRLMAPEKKHYQIPAVGAHGRRTTVRDTNYLPDGLRVAAGEGCSE